MIELSDAQLKRLNQALKHGSNDIVLILPLSQIKMQGGVFGWVSDSNKFISAVKDGFSVN